MHYEVLKNFHAKTEKFQKIASVNMYIVLKFQQKLHGILEVEIRDPQISYILRWNASHLVSREEGQGPYPTLLSFNADKAAPPPSTCTPL